MKKVSHNIGSIKRIATLLTMALIVALQIQASTSVIVVRAQQYPVPREESFIRVAWAKLTYYHFNPFIPNDNWQNLFGPMNNEPLWFYDVYKYPHDIIWWRATGYEYNRDYTTLTIRLRPGVKWNDGKPFTSEDVKFTIQLEINKSMGQHWTIGAYLSSIETPDQHTVVFKFTQPQPRAHTILSAEQTQYFLPKHIWQNVDPLNFTNLPPVTTGPYKLYNVYPDQGMIIWVRDENWWAKEVMGWQAGPKYVIALTERPADILYQMIAAGDIDYGYMKNVETTRKVSMTAHHVTTVRSLEPVCDGIHINCAKYPLNYTEVRRAITYCLDLLRMPPKEAAEVPYPSRAPWPTSQFSLRDFAYDDLFKLYGPTDLGRNYTEANRLLDNLNFKDRDGDGIRETPNGTKLSFEIISPSFWALTATPIHLALTETTKNIGVQFTSKLLDSAVFNDRANMGLYDLYAAWISWPTTGDLYSGLMYLHSKYYKPIGQKSVSWLANCRFTDPELDSILDRLDVINKDHPDAKALYKRAAEIYLRGIPHVGVYEACFSTACSEKYWIGYPKLPEDQVPKDPPYNGVPWPAEDPDRFDIWTTAQFTSYFGEAVLHLRPAKWVGVWFTKDIPRFVGWEGKAYGPYKSGDFAQIPQPNATMLVAAGKASYTLAPVEAVVPKGLGETVNATYDAVKGITSTLSKLESSISKTTELAGPINNLSATVSNMATLLYATISLNVVLLAIVLVIVVRVRK